MTVERRHGPRDRRAALPLGAQTAGAGEATTLLLAGDVMTGRGIDQALPHPGAPDLYEPVVRDAREYLRLAESVHGPAGAPLAPHEPWGDALAAMRAAAAELRIVNLETAITTCSVPWPGKGIHYRMHPANMEVLRVAGIDCCVLANNHVLDWGREGLLQTLHTLHDAGIVTAGAGRDADAAWAPAVLPLPRGRRVLVWGLATPSSGVPADWAAAAHRPGVALLPDLSRDAARRVADVVIRERCPGDIVVVSIHWGSNWVPAVPQAHREFAQRLIELGAVDVLHGHSSHHPLPVEVHRGRPILYGCGDLINDYEGIGAHADFPLDLAGLYVVRLAAAGQGLQRLDVLPLQRRRLRLQHADAEAMAAWRRALAVDRPGAWRWTEAAHGGWSLGPASMSD